MTTPRSIVDLFNYMERRFDAIEAILATKADKSEIANMATKEDIKDMVTKADIKDMVTKGDIKNMVIRADIKDMATKHDIADMATKHDFNELYNLLDGLAGNYETEEINRLGMKDQLRRQQKWIDQAPLSSRPV